MTVYPGEVMCLLGDNGAGKSTLIKILSGVHQPSEGEYLVDGQPVHFASPRDALDGRHRHGLPGPGDDPADERLAATSSSAPSRKSAGVRSAASTSRRPTAVTRDELPKMGIHIRDTDQAVGTLSGGERQSVAIARAVYFGAKVLILDEPTAALGVKEAGVVLRYIAQARARGSRRRLHHPQRPPRLPDRRPLHAAQPRRLATAPSPRRRSAAKRSSR